MTKKELRWRFKNLPTVNEVQQLIDVKVITAEEARELLFNESQQTEESDKIEAMQNQIEFLERLVHDLAKSKSETHWPTYINTFVRTVPAPMFPIYYSSTGTTSVSASAGNIKTYAQSLLN